MENTSEKFSKNKPNDFLLIYCTVPDAKTGEQIAKHLLSLKLIACANVSSNFMSFYEWEGKFHSDKEALLICKTKKTCYERVEKEIVSKHPYQCPALCAFAFERAHPPFLDWIESQCS